MASHKKRDSGAYGRENEMVELLRERKRRTETMYNRSFRYVDNPFCGYGFACDKDGNVDKDSMNPSALPTTRCA